MTFAAKLKPRHPQMNVFEFRERLVGDYNTFTRSFTRILADDIRAYVDREYSSQRYWPEPLIQVNPNFKLGHTIEELVATGTLHPECARIFRQGKSASSAGNSLRLFRHQEEALALAAAHESYVLTTGTGSGKSLAYFIPIVDATLRAKALDPTPRTRAIVIYPMNALANSQLEELGKFLGDYGEHPPVTFGRYTGQESQDERQRLAATPPDVLLTNFMMLELLLTRQDDKDKAIVRNAKGLSYLVLDELHTYRGRQGADVGILARRARECMSEELVCIGTSATMASEGRELERNGVVARVTERLFGTAISAANVITETLQRVTPETESLDAARTRLAAAISAGVPARPSFNELATHPLAVWVELTLGLENDSGKWRRAKPRTLAQAAAQLALDSGLPESQCRDYLQAFLLLAYSTIDAAGRSLFAFKLHQFVSGGGKVFTTLEAPGRRQITLDGQQYLPGDRARRLYAAHFCRECGQEYYPVWDADSAEGRQLEARDIDDRLNDDEDVHAGYFMPDTAGGWSEGAPEKFPETWLETAASGELRVKSSYRAYVPQPVRLRPDGLRVNDGGTPGWFIPGAFRFCLNCQFHYQTAGKDSLRLTALAGEGRSSATTMLTVSALRYLYEQDEHLPAEAKKVLGFSDNRQDAALQAGHFNDFLQVLLIRSALHAALEGAGAKGLGEQDIPHAIFASLGFDRDDRGVRSEYMQQPDAKGNARRQVQDAMRNILGYRAYYDLRRGWRFNNPNLEQLGLLRVDYQDVDELAADADEWRDAPLILQVAEPGVRAAVLRLVFDQMRQGLCVATRYLDHNELDQLRTLSFANLREPWGFTEEERPQNSKWLITRSLPKDVDPRKLDHLVSGSARSRLGRELRKPSLWGGANPYAARISDADYLGIVNAVMKAASGPYRLVRAEQTDIDAPGYQLVGSALIWRLGDGQSPRQADDNPFFRNLIRNIAALLANSAHRLFDFEAREHTAQVEQEDRLEREARFRFTPKDRADWLREKGQMLEWLPVLFCSPTMELGVDIATLNTVYLRNVPPTPANYAQRSGRAGRAGQPALVITYCASQSPHDQYYFRDPVRMVHGQVNPPTLDLANLELIKAHLQAIWLAETGQKLDSSIRGLLDMSASDDLPLLPEIAHALDRPEVQRRAHARGVRVLAMLGSELTAQRAPWYSAGWAEGVFQHAHVEFDRALQRWRDLYRATARQIDINFRIENNPAASERERREAQQRHNEARRQRDLLLAGDSAFNSDFYTYRYLASQAFLPGYNFPRLPLLAYIPARRGNIGRESFLSRPRFLALSEFGPYSLIYHEGSQYRVTKALLTISGDDQVTQGAKLATEVARLCPACGYGHFRTQRDADRCVSCGVSLGGAPEVRNLYRIENVSTRRAERITANEEERVRQGYEMQTTLQFGEVEGRLQQFTTQVSDTQGPLLELQYGPAATVWRMNLGWRRRKEKSLLGFNINPVTGHWVGGLDGTGRQAEENNSDAPPDKTPPQRIVPYVEDRRNVLVVRPAAAVGALAPSTMATLQHALKRGIESVYQLEESELMSEPLPNRDLRHSILFYEAAEGGAGVLTRIATEPDALAEVAARALEIMHFRSPAGGQWADQLTDSLTEELDNGNPICEAGCYRCLLSYYNQPDHKLIDRQDKESGALLLTLLRRLTRAGATTGSEGRAPGQQAQELLRTAGSALERAWLEYVDRRGHRRPDRGQVTIETCRASADFLYEDFQLAVFIDGPHHDADAQRAKDADVSRRLEEAGYLVVRFPHDQAKWPAIFARHADLFGKGTTVEA